jgi:hypothetical protein
MDAKLTYKCFSPTPKEECARSLSSSLLFSSLLFSRMGYSRT